MQFKSALFSVALAVLLIPAAASAQGSPTLGQLSKKEQERRKSVKAPATKVLTTQDVPKGTPAPQPAAAEPGAQQPGAEKEAGKKPQDPAKDEASWRQRMLQAREELRRNEMFAEALQTRINSLTNDFSSRDDPYQRAKVAEERTKAILELERVRADAEANRKKIADIEEEARRAGVPPGWLR